MQITTPKQFQAALAIGSHAWPGGYPTYYVTSDGGILCPACAKTEKVLIYRAIHEKDNSGWRVVGQDINYEDDNLLCDHCGKQIESAYGDAD